MSQTAIRPNTDSLGKALLFCFGRIFSRSGYLSRISVLIAAVFSCFSMSGVPADKKGPITDYPRAYEIVNRAIALSEKQHELNVEAMFESRVLSSVQSLDANGEVTKTAITKHRQYPLKGALFDELIEKDGRPLNEKELRDEEKRRREFIREVEERIECGDDPQPEKDPGIRFNQELMSRYRVEVVGTEIVRGHPCWMIAFEPKEGDLPVRNRMDLALNQCTGMLWISQDDYGVARLKFTLDKPFKYWGGLLAVIRNTDGRLENIRVGPDIWLPASFELKLDFKVMMIKNIRRLMTIRWTDYKGFDSPVANEMTTESKPSTAVTPLRNLPPTEE